MIAPQIATEQGTLHVRVIADMIAGGSAVVVQILERPYDKRKPQVPLSFGTVATEDEAVVEDFALKLAVKAVRALEVKRARRKGVMGEA